MPSPQPLPGWFATGHVLLGNVGQAVWLLPPLVAACAAAALLIQPRRAASTVPVAAPHDVELDAAAVDGVDDASSAMSPLAVVLLLWCTAAAVQLLHAVTARARPPLYSNRLHHLWSDYLHPRHALLVLLHVAAGLAAFRLLAALAPSHWSTLFPPGCSPGLPCKAHEPAVFFLLHGVLAGLVFGTDYVLAGRYLLRFPVVQQPRYFRLRGRLGAVVSRSLTLTWSILCRSVPLYHLCVYLFGWSPASLLTSALGRQLGSEGVRLVDLRLLWATAVSTAVTIFSWNAGREILEIFKTHIPTGGIPLEPDDQLTPALGRNDCALLQHLAFADLHAIALRSRERRADIFGNSWAKIRRCCLDELRALAREADPLGSAEVYEMPRDYTLNPLDDPSLISNGPTRPKHAPWSPIPEPAEVKMEWVGQHAAMRSPYGNGSASAAASARSPTGLSVRRLRAGLSQNISDASLAQQQLKLKLKIREAWYQPNIGREQALRMLESQPEGSFVVHRHELQGDCLALTAVQDSWKTTPVHHAASAWTGTVVHTARGFRLQDDLSGVTLASLPDLVRYYANHPYCTDFAGERRFLVDIDEGLDLRGSLRRRWNDFKEQAVRRLRRYRNVAWALDKSPAERRTNALGNLAVQVWAARSLAALLVCAKSEDKHGVVMRQAGDFSEVVEVLLNTLAAVQTLIRAQPALAVARNVVAVDDQASQITGHKAAVATATEPADAAGVKAALVAALAQLIQAYPGEMHRLLELLPSQQAARLREVMNSL